MSLRHVRIDAVEWPSASSASRVGTVPQPRAFPLKPWLLIAVALVGTLIAYLVVSLILYREATTALRVLPDGQPSNFGLSYEDVTFASLDDQVTLRGWLLAGSGERVIVLVHGLDGNRWSLDPTRASEATGVPGLAVRYVHAGYNVLVFDLRGHGTSDPAPLSFGWTERQDVQGAIRFLESRGFQPGSIGLQGFSYGAATALLAAAESPDVAAVIADSAFADANELLGRELDRRGVPAIFLPGLVFLIRPLQGFELEQVAPIRHVGRIAPRPILFIHGDADSRIPYSNSVRLREAAGGTNDGLWLVPGSEHTQALEFLPEEYAARSIAFFDRYLHE